MPSNSVAPSASSAEHEASRPRHEGRGEVGAHHVERAVRQADEIHDAEHQRQPCASRNSSKPNCNPFKNCSATRNMNRLYQAETK
jgi:hypothetical protein